MLKKKTVFTNLILLFLICSQFGSRAIGQSGRPLPAPDVKPEITQAKESVDENPVCEENPNEIEFIEMTERDEFIGRINKYGLCGYRVEKVAKIPIYSDKTLEQISFTALVKKDGENKYEYSWFITESPGQAQTLANNLAANDFYLKKAFPFTIGACGERADKIIKENDKDGILGQLANKTIGDDMIFFLFERKVGSPKKNEYRIIDAEIPGTNFRENERKMQDLTAKGFRPVELWYLGFLQYHFVIMEKDEDIKPQGEYIFDKELYGVDKDLTKYAEKGYELLIMGTGLSVLNRTSSSPRNVKYYSFDNYKKFKKKFTPILPKATLVETGLDFTVLYCDLYESRWFFTVPLNYDQNTPQIERVFLNMYDFYSAYRVKNRVSAKTELTKEQLKEIEKETTGRINRLLKENYEVVNFNYLDGYTVMLERTKK